MKTNRTGEKTIGDSIALEILISSVKLPPLPTHGAKLLEMAQQPLNKIDIASFARLVEVDPGLFASVLQLANSPYYKGVDKIISLRSAITRIGLSETINSICLYFFQKMLPKIPPIEGVSSKDLWAYSWACATANRRLGHPNLEMGVLPGELYIAGLLHGIGKLMLAIHYPHDFSKCILMAQRLQQPLHKMELDIFGTTDAQVAAKIMEFWQLPANICAGVAFYQVPEEAPPPYKEIAGLTQLAHGIAALSGIGTSGDGSVMDLSAAYMCRQSHLPISKPEIREKIIQEILNALEEKSESVTGFSSRALPLGSPAPGEKKDPGSKALGKMADVGQTVVNKPLKEDQKEGKKKGLFAWIKSLLGRS